MLSYEMERWLLNRSLYEIGAFALLWFIAFIGILMGLRGGSRWLGIGLILLLPPIGMLYALIQAFAGKRTS